MLAPHARYTACFLPKSCARLGLHGLPARTGPEPRHRRRNPRGCPILSRAYIDQDQRIVDEQARNELIRSAGLVSLVGPLHRDAAELGRDITLMGRFTCRPGNLIRNLKRARLQHAQYSQGSREAAVTRSRSHPSSASRCRRHTCASGTSSSC